jgi:hypothetical protein
MLEKEAQIFKLQRANQRPLIMKEKQALAKARYYAMEYIEEHRPPLHLRNKVDLGFTLEDRELRIFEIRPLYNDPSTKIESDVARAKYVKSRDIWKIYWKRANGNWEPYRPGGDFEVDDVTEFFSILDEDKYGAFWG